MDGEIGDGAAQMGDWVCVCVCVFTVRNSAVTRHRLPNETQRLGIKWPSSIRAASSTTGRGRLQENLAKPAKDKHAGLGSNRS